MLTFFFEHPHLKDSYVVILWRDTVKKNHWICWRGTKTNHSSIPFWDPNGGCGLSIGKITNHLKKTQVPCQIQVQSFFHSAIIKYHWPCCQLTYGKNPWKSMKISGFPEKPWFFSENSHGNAGSTDSSRQRVSGVWVPLADRSSCPSPWVWWNGNFLYP